MNYESRKLRKHLIVNDKKLVFNLRNMRANLGRLSAFLHHYQPSVHISQICHVNFDLLFSLD